MQAARFLQAVVLMMVVALAASCATGKEYTSKIFAPRNTVAKDSAVTASPKFLDMGDEISDSTSMVSTEVFSGKDTVIAVSAAYEKNVVKADTIVKTESTPAEPGVRIVKNGETRNKRKRE